MIEHKGMGPQDVAVLLKIVTLGTAPWLSRDQASARREPGGSLQLLVAFSIGRFVGPFPS